jgi:hypothetical protein
VARQHWAAAPGPGATAAGNSVVIRGRRTGDLLTDWGAPVAWHGLIDADQAPPEKSGQTTEMNATRGRESVVLGVDNDSAMRDSLSFLFRSVGLDTLAFASASDFLQNQRPDVPS